MLSWARAHEPTGGSEQAARRNRLRLIVSGAIQLAGIRRLANHSAIRGIRASFWAFADQALISGSSFIVMVLLARELGPGAFGAFVLAQAVLMFACGIQSALFTQPHNVLGAARTGHDYADYTHSVFLAQLVFALTVGLTLGCVAVIFMGVGSRHGPLLLALAFAAPAWQLQDFLRRVLYTQGDYSAAFAYDLVAYGGQVAGVVVLWSTDRMSAVHAVAVVGAATAAGFLLASWHLRTVLFRPLRWKRQRVHQDIAENWVFGRWMLGSVLASWLSVQLYPLLTAGFVGVAATGGMRATQTLVAPTHILLKSLEGMMPSRVARVLNTEGLAGLRPYAKRFAYPAAAIMAAYCALVFVAAEPLVGIVVGEQYTSYAWLVRVFAFSYLLTFTSTVGTVILTGAERSSAMFYANLGSAIVVLTLGVWGVAAFGLAGAMAGLILHGVVHNAILWHFVRLEFRR